MSRDMARRIRSRPTAVYPDAEARQYFSIRWTPSEILSLTITYHCVQLHAVFIALLQLMVTTTLKPEGNLKLC